MKKLVILLPIVLLSVWLGYGALLQNQIPSIKIYETNSIPINKEHTLPFYELMSPIPSWKDAQLIPKLEYKKGPPQRFIERISILVQPKASNSKERIVYYGRKTDSISSPALYFFKGEKANFLHASLLYSQTGKVPDRYADIPLFFLKPFLLKRALSALNGVESVYIMDQAGTPAFLFIHKASAEERHKAVALFSRRNSLYRMDFIGDHGFHKIQPLDIFRKTFLVEKRSDAMEYLAKNLAEIKLEQRELSSLKFRDIAWPILLLAANVSVDPSSVESFFHFAGISALLYKTTPSDLETMDILRNNVLASAFYAKDINPSARQTAEIHRLARLLTRNFSQ